MADERDLIKRIEDTQKNWFGRDAEFDPEASIGRFSLQSPEARAELLDNIDQAMQDADTTDIRKYAEVTSLRNRLRTAHHALRKANR